MCAATVHREAYQPTNSHRHTFNYDIIYHQIQMSISIEGRFRESAVEMELLESLGGLSFVLSIDGTTSPHVRAILARRIAQHGGVSLLEP